MKKEDGQNIFSALQEWLTIELQAGNRVTKNNSNYLGGVITNIVNKIIANDVNKELLWEENGKEWLAKREKGKESKREVNDSLVKNDNIIKMEKEIKDLENKTKARK